MAIVCRNCLVSVLAFAGASWFANSSVVAQTLTLPTIDVSTRIRTVAPGAPASTIVPAPPSPGEATRPAAAGIGIVGASTSVIARRDIEESPAQNLPDILAQQTGVQIQHLAGSRSAVDLRGFGAFAHSNVLILVNGRRYQDFDLQGFDLASIPLNSVERIEVTRGNSGAVLYGDGAIGGVINIVTKSGVGLPPAARIEGVLGSYGRGEGRASANTSWGPWSTSIAANVVGETGYRRNSELRQQNVVGRLDYRDAGWASYLHIAADNQQQGLPGGLFNFNPIYPFTLATPRESVTPFDIGDKQGINLTGGVVVPVAAGADLTVDGGVRRKLQQAQFFNYFQSVFPFAFDPASATPANYVDTAMTTTSLTPRLDLAHGAFGVPNKLLTGIDIYDTRYESDRSQSPRTPAIHRYDIRQTTVAYYGMNKSSVTPNMDVSFGGRIQHNNIDARDIYDPSVDPNFFFYGTSPQAPPLNSSEWQYAAHVGAEYRVDPFFAVFGRAARAFRLPNADERVGAGNPFGLTAPANFGMKTQTSYDFEGGVRVRGARFQLESSVYDMYLENEIHFIPALQQNINLDPTRRTGWETSAMFQAADDLRLRGGVAYVRAIFRDGPFAGNDVPLVSRWTGHASLTWNIWRDALVLDVTSRFWSERRMDNDQREIQPLIPANATVDVKISGAHRNFFWSAAVLNVFDVEYFDYAIASGGFPAGPFLPATPPTIGQYSAYPQAGRTFLLRAGATF